MKQEWKAEVAGWKQKVTVTNGVVGATGCSLIGEAGHFSLLGGCGCSLAGCADKAAYPDSLYQHVHDCCYPS